MKTTLNDCDADGNNLEPRATYDDIEPRDDREIIRDIMLGSGFRDYEISDRTYPGGLHGYEVRYAVESSAVKGADYYVLAHSGC